MAKVYMRADENEAGVTVEDSSPTLVKIRVPDTHGLLATDPEARAVVEGLLRRMLGEDRISHKAYHAIGDVLEYLKERRR